MRAVILGSLSVWMFWTATFGGHPLVVLGLGGGALGYLAFTEHSAMKKKKHG